MTASLYQSASSPAVAAVGSGEAAPSPKCAGFGMGSPVYTEHVGGKGEGAELDVVVRAFPEVAPAAEQVLDQEFLAFGDVELSERQAYPARLDVERVEVDDHQDEILLLAFRVTDQLVVRDRVEAQAPVRLQRRIAFSYGIQS